MNYKYAGITSVLYLSSKIIPSHINDNGFGYLLLISIFPYLLYRLKHLLNNRYNYRYADLPIRIVIITLLAGFLLFSIHVLFINSTKSFAAVLVLISLSRGISYIFLGFVLALRVISLLGTRFKLLGYILSFSGFVQIVSCLPNLMFWLPKGMMPSTEFFVIYLNALPIVWTISMVLLFGWLPYIFFSAETWNEDCNGPSDLSN